MKKVLIADDEPRNHAILGYVFDKMPDKVTVLYATTRKEAKELFDANSDLDLIALDACMPHPDALPSEHYKPNTQGLAHYMKESFKGPLVAVSSEEIFNKMLREAGCTHDCSKEEFGEIALALLGL